SREDRPADPFHSGRPPPAATTAPMLTRRLVTALLDRRRRRTGSAHPPPSRQGRPRTRVPPEPGADVIRAEDLTKRYGALVAADRVSFAVGAGEIFGLLGPNGAGKTTTLEMLEGLRQPDGGAAYVLG